MRKWLPAIALLCAAFGTGWYLLFHSSGTSANHHAATLAAPATGPLRSQMPPAVVQSLHADPVAAPTTAAASPGMGARADQGLPASATSRPSPATVLENVRTGMRNYAQRFGGNPVGRNFEITRALKGGNPKKVNFLDPDAGLRVNDKGELVDPWGTPFFFHQLSGTEMEIRSAGPDRAMWTSDDLVCR